MNLLERVKKVCADHPCYKCPLNKHKPKDFYPNGDKDRCMLNDEPYYWNTDEIVRLLDGVKEGENNE